MGWLEVCQGSMVNVLLEFSQIFIQESATLDLANDCYRFVAGHFDLIRTSSQHIYHSALVLSPKTSIVRKLYESHSQPFVRIVHGVPESWESSTAATTLPFQIETAMWSPCNRFIAICPYDAERVDMLDPATLQRIRTLGPWGRFISFPVLIFSPDGRLLTCSGRGATRLGPAPSSLQAGSFTLILTWDLQTGGVVSVIQATAPRGYTRGKCSIVYSTDGQMVAYFFPLLGGGAVMSIFDVFSGVHIHNVGCYQLDDLSLCHIWAHGESIRFVTAKPTRMTIWEVGFALGATPTEVRTLPSPDDIGKVAFVKFLPTLDKVAFTYANKIGSTNIDQVLVWDFQDSKSLLHHTDVNPYHPMTFSSDGNFLACLTARSGIYLWKESPTGYILHRNLLSWGEPLLSPDGKLIITISGSMVQLWHTGIFTTTPSSAPPQPQQIEKFILDFVPDKSLAVVTQQKGNMVTILDLKSSVPLLMIEAPMEVHGLRVINNILVTIGSNKVITWNLSAGDTLPDVGLNIGDSAQTIHLSDEPLGVYRDDVTAASISPDFHYVALDIKTRGSSLPFGCLSIYSMSNGEYLGSAGTMLIGVPWFGPGRDNIWYAFGNKAYIWTVNGENLDHTMTVHDIVHGSWGCPWEQSCGYQVADDGWILSMDGKRLMLLPSPWQSEAAERVWNGQFLALLHAGLPKPVIIELEP